ncbi:Retrovirus-related Pol polyprotein from transposon TNT 1-94 [Gossypium australe]|uniref:Retrovirus-related Pol polyprotein from transposon TNT 1-94 n=1 Tax=Gossypium australe TaxID=47621 RepID=A0A5B6WID7_9ROSI|nr:Retrovirus-related Pol polyprotein from transposon TNT 1-94 [Gossypium australe]
MNQPPGFEVVNDHRQRLACRLNKYIYGLKQAPRAWFEKLRNFLVQQLNFKPSRADSSLFYKHTNAGSGDYAELGVVVSCLDHQFSLKDLRELGLFLGLEVLRHQDRMQVSQQEYASELLEQANTLNTKPMNTPMVSSPTLTSLVGSSLSDGSLQYLYSIRPDLSFAINKVSQYMHKPHDVDWTTVKRILQYDKGTIDYGLLFQASSMSLTSFSDADWASSVEDRKATSGFCAYLGDNLVGWMSSKQSVVSQSTTEAEYRSLANATSELTVVSLDTNSMLHAKVKHVELDIHFVRDKVLSDQLCVSFVPGCD